MQEARAHNRARAAQDVNKERFGDGDTGGQLDGIEQGKQRNHIKQNKDGKRKATMESGWGEREGGDKRRNLLDTNSVCIN